jgi:hypothetical protein
LKQAFSEHTVKEIEIFTTKEDPKEAVANLASKDDLNDLRTSQCIDREIRI